MARNNSRGRPAQRYKLTGYQYYLTFFKTYIELNNLKGSSNDFNNYLSKWELMPEQSKEIFRLRARGYTGYILFIKEGNPKSQWRNLSEDRKQSYKNELNLPSILLS